MHHAGIVFNLFQKAKGECRICPYSGRNNCGRIAPIAMPIQILSDDLAAKIAAGEVIERPASIVKELIENSLDAGARDIRIEVRGGGQRLLRVADDGGGIPASEVVTAFARHATSKIKSVEDLSAIRTLGFRGEALPSIAAVARVTVITRAQGEEQGTLYKLEESRTLAHQPHGAPRGTVVTVEELFQNIPARLKFIKAYGTEAAHIAELVNAYALAYPTVRFSLVNDGRLLFQCSGNGKLFDALIKVLGVETAREMIQVTGGTGDPTAGDQPSTIQVGGYVSPPSVHRASRKTQYLFVNGRWIEDRALSHAVVEAYHTMLMVGRYPLYVLNVKLPLDAIDVNVHPTKAQVRFQQPGDVYGAVQRTVRRALTEAAPVPNIASGVPVIPSQQIELRQRLGGTGHSAPGLVPPADDRGQHPAYVPPSPVADFPQTPIPRPPGPSGGDRGALSEAERRGVEGGLPTVGVPMLRVIGQIASTYIIAEGPHGLYLVDQHAAHERVLYEQFTAAHAAMQSPSQALLEPLAVGLSAAQWVVYDEQRELLEHVGFRLEAFGGQTLMLRAIPSVLKDREPRGALVQVLDEMGEGSAPLGPDAETRLITSICKSAAVKGGQTMSLEEMRALVRDLEKTSAPHTCPHGRPTMIQLNLAQLEREFGRRG
jgi:DNA mismatch repair protein MutL